MDRFKFLRFSYFSLSQNVEWNLNFDSFDRPQYFSTVIYELDNLWYCHLYLEETFWIQKEEEVSLKFAR